MLHGRLENGQGMRLIKGEYFSNNRAPDVLSRTNLRRRRKIQPHVLDANALRSSKTFSTTVIQLCIGVNLVSGPASILDPAFSLLAVHILFQAGYALVSTWAEGVDRSPNQRYKVLQTSRHPSTASTTAYPVSASTRSGTNGAYAHTHRTCPRAALSVAASSPSPFGTH